jgi:hypothetical protein
MAVQESNRERLASAKEVAEYLGITPGALAQNRRRGVGPRWISHGRRVLYRWRDIESYLDGATVSRD